MTTHSFGDSPALKEAFGVQIVDESSSFEILTVTADGFRVQIGTIVRRNDPTGGVPKSAVHILQPLPILVDPFTRRTAGRGPTDFASGLDAADAQKGQSILGQLQAALHRFALAQRPFEGRPHFYPLSLIRRVGQKLAIGLADRLEYGGGVLRHADAMFSIEQNEPNASLSHRFAVVDQT
jgi:hypothetical protein